MDINYKAFFQGFPRNGENDPKQLDCGESLDIKENGKSTSFCSPIVSDRHSFTHVYV